MEPRFKRQGRSTTLYGLVTCTVLGGSCQSVGLPEENEVQRAFFSPFLCFSPLQLPMAQSIYWRPTFPPSISVAPQGHGWGAVVVMQGGWEGKELPRTSGCMLLNFREPVVALKYHKHLPLPPPSLKIPHPSLPRLHLPPVSTGYANSGLSIQSCFALSLTLSRSPSFSRALFRLLPLLQITW